MDMNQLEAKILRHESDPSARKGALLRLLAFFGLGIALIIIAAVIGHWFIKLKPHSDTSLSVGMFLPAEILMALLTVVLPTAIMIRWKHDPLAWAGLGQATACQGSRARQLGVGLVTGFGMMTLLLVILRIFGVFSFGSLSLSLGQALLGGGGYLLTFACVAVAEEGLFRGYGLVQLSRIVSFWPAAILSSLLFGAAHMTHLTENPLGLIEAGLIGFVFAYSFWRSGALFFAWGCHAAWDFAETFVYGVPDSGTTVSDALIHSSLHGPLWLTGGSAGPEASVIGLPIILGIALIARRTLRPL